MKILLVLAVLLPLSQQYLYECPSDWVEFTAAKRCYYFGRNPKLDWSSAKEACQRNGATLLSVNGDEGLSNEDENNFLGAWLRENDQTSNEWYTSGQRSGADAASWIWSSINLEIRTPYFWLPTSPHDKDGAPDYIIYNSTDGQWGWTVADSDTPRSYICEISRSQAFKISSTNRDFEFGQDVTDPEKIPRGPYFKTQPKDTVWDKDSVGRTVTFECLAGGYPPPKYHWYIISRGQPVPIDFTESGTRFSLTNGDLTITEPEQEDNANYQCSSENKFGKIFSNHIEFKVGFLQDFSNVNRNPIRITAYEGAAIPCAPPAHSPPELLYSWFKNKPQNQIKPHLKPHIFNSYTGNLYFQYVTMDDKGNYFCVASSPAAKTGASGAGKTSASNPLVVTSGASQNVDPKIVSGFPTAFPPSPRIGDTLRLECVAYGTGKLKYRWSKPGGAMPPRAILSDNGRVVTIPNLKIGEAGTYKCSVTADKVATESTAMIQVAMQYAPLFSPGLVNQHLDIGSSLLWFCEAQTTTRDPAKYEWYVNGTKMDRYNIPVEDRERIFIDELNQKLEIRNLQRKDAGMYQCRARNTVGSRFSTAQLRVLAFEPTFVRNPVREQMYGARQGNLTMVCNPQAAPKAETQWYKNDRLFNAGGGRITLLDNGNLFFTQIRPDDQGRYKCEAKNEYGEDTSEGQLTVVDAVNIVEPPRRTSVRVNESAVLYCDATVDDRLDLAFIWKLNGRKIIFNIEFYAYKLGYGNRVGALHIVRADFNMSGEYTCVAQTAVTTDAEGRSALLTVIGPPGPPAGVQALMTETTASNVTLQWQLPSRNGKPIIAYIIEGMNTRMRHYEVLKDNVVGSDMQSRSTVVRQLAPGSSYKFRVRARNELGTGPPSPDLDQWVTTLEAPPTVAPKDVQGGGGKVGTLTVNWTPLPPEHQGGDGMGYRVFSRKFRNQNELTWETNVVYGTQENRITRTVGKKQSFLWYESKVQAFNNRGAGPNSTIVRIRSAENLPLVRPDNVWATSYNASAIRVYWNKIAVNQTNVRGLLQGFKINYWLEDGEEISLARRATIFNPQATQGLVIGLHSNTWYQVAVMVYNDAGNGPPSEYFPQRTLKKPPLLGPLHVKAEVHEEDDIRITWQGVSTTLEEEPLEGYKVRYWEIEQNIREATDRDAGRSTSFVMKGMNIGVTYNLRVLGYSLGGEGKMSSPVISFRLGEGGYIEASGIRQYIGSAATVSPSLVALLCISFAALFVLH